MRPRSPLGLLALTTVALTLAACGGGDTGTGAAGGEETSATGGGAAAAEPITQLEIIAPAAPGSGWDQTSRAVQAALQDESLAEQVTVTNVPGASGTVALAQIAPQTGKEGLWMASGLAMMTGIITNNADITLDDVTPLARMIGEYEVIVVPAASEFQTLDDLLTAIEEDPAAVPIAGGSAGSADHLFLGLLAEARGITPSDLNYVPFSGGGEATTALLGNQVAAGISGTGEFAAQIESGELRALVVSSLEPVSSIPDAPTLTDEGLEDLEFFNWRSIMAPADLPQETIDQYIATLDALQESETWQQTLTDNAWDDAYLSGEEFGTWLEEENTRVTEVLEGLGLVQ
ncbi:tripartite tricarboxylate transporter substrate binding protein [Cellulomonas fimi]|uniref:Tripartite tricarboxylate transporter substrate binding protein n=1 Tax=Cellulomonas fimi TaxID=1708 RepID=A0A7Y0LWA3_CELFI|nr:tripartite tricarboxylate transporter substrate-binding protein [Cellulomonas fimi]NMR19056.1 tripartite tricarboxylate transporter substrate binding protein [Cellulomonas fimi]